MVNSETKRKLREMNLSEIITALEIQQNDPATIALSFDERIQRLTDYVYQEKYNHRIQRLIKSARLRFPQADIQHFLPEGRGMDMQLLTATLFGCHPNDINKAAIFSPFQVHFSYRIRYIL